MNTQKNAETLDFRANWIKFHIRAACPTILYQGHISLIEKCPHACLPRPSKKTAASSRPGLPPQHRQSIPASQVTTQVWTARLICV